MKNRARQRAMDCIGILPWERFKTDPLGTAAFGAEQNHKVASSPE
jgi:hypothetical protein